MAAKRKTVAELQLEAHQALEALNEFKRESEDRIRQRDAQIKQRDAQLAALTAENNQMRDRLFDAEQELSRRAGYMQAVEDMQPPKMVAVERQARSLTPETPHNGLEIFTHYGDNTPPRRWYHRP